MAIRFIIMLTTMYLPVSLIGITVNQIIHKIDRQQRVRSSSFQAKMTIRKGSRTLVKQFHGFGIQKGNRFFFTFTNPADRGVKYLRRNNNLWIYFPDADDIMRISGHMLRRGMMGSDISYEDLMEFEHFEKKYTPILLGTKTIHGKQCYEILCTARKSNLTYYKQRLFVDTNHFTLRKVQLYTRSGRLLKEFIRSDFRKIGWRYTAFKITIKDVRRSDSLTEIKYSKIRFNVPISSRIFTLRNLRR